MSTDSTDGMAARPEPSYERTGQGEPQRDGAATAAYAPTQAQSPGPPTGGPYQPQPGYAPQGQYPPGGHYGPPQHYQQDSGPGLGDRASNAMNSIGRHVKTPETKEFFKTSEFGVWLFTVVALVIAGAVIDASSHGDVLRADLVWKLVTAVSAVYILSRGIAKAGTRRGYGDRPMDRD
jgi:hypothetical protein